MSQNSSQIDALQKWQKFSIKKVASNFNFDPKNFQDLLLFRTNVL